MSSQLFGPESGMAEFSAHHKAEMQDAGQAEFLSGGSGDKSTSKVIQFHGVIGLRSPFPC